MGDKTDFHENMEVEATFRGGAWSVPATWYVALLQSVTDKEGGVFTEAAYPGYARTPVANSALEWTAVVAGNGTTTNVNAVAFPAPTGPTGGEQETYFALMDAASAGNARYISVLTNPKTINFGDPGPYFPAGALSVQVDN